MARRYNRRPVGRGQKRDMFWARRTGLITFDTANQASIVSLLGDFNQAYGANLFGFTVTRIRGHFTHFTTSTVEPSTSYRMSVGIRKDERIDASTAAGGVTGIADTDPEQSVKQPFEDPYSDWMYARNCLGIVGSAGDEWASGDQVANNRVELDLKSQRKFSELNETLYMIVGTSWDGDDPVQFWYDMHVLLKQP